VYSTGDYPLGAANDPRAPYNQVDNPEIEVTIGVWYSIYKEVKIKTSDYETEEWEDEDGHQWKPNFNNTDFSSLIDNACPPPEGWQELDCDFTIV